MRSTPTSENGDPDRRFLEKLVTRPLRSAGTPTPLTSDLGWIRYLSPSTPIPLIKNEELVLLRAEANLGLGNLSAAVSDIDIVCTRSGGLASYSGSINQASLLTELLYNKRYSLLFEGAHTAGSTTADMVDLPIWARLTVGENSRTCFLIRCRFGRRKSWLARKLLRRYSAVYSGVQRSPDLLQMMLVVSRDLFKFVSQRPHSRLAVHELEVAFLFAVLLGVVDDCAAN